LEIIVLVSRCINWSQSEGAVAPHIGNNVFIGSAKIIGDVTIGDNVIIAPNTNVIKDIGDKLYSCVGNHAKIIKKY
jgi:serine acetyltransferase